MTITSTVVRDHERLSELMIRLQTIESGQDRGAADQAVTAVVAHVFATRRHLCGAVRGTAGGGCVSADEHSLRRLEVAATDVLRSNLGDVRLRASRGAVIARLADAFDEHRRVEEDGGLLLRVEQSVPPQASFQLAQRLTDGLTDSPSRPHPWVSRFGWLQRCLHAPLRRLDAIRDVLDNRIPPPPPRRVRIPEQPAATAGAVSSVPASPSALNRAGSPARG